MFCCQNENDIGGEWGAVDVVVIRNCINIVNVTKSTVESLMIPIKCIGQAVALP